MMSTEDAFQIVMDLARKNIIGEHEADLILDAERRRQVEAYKTVEDFAVNNIFE